MKANALLCPLLLLACSAGCVSETPSVAEPVAEVPAANPAGFNQDWQKMLIDDLEAVETHGNVFLDGAFKLYDQLLSEEPVSPDRQTQLDADVAASSAHYAQLVEAITKLKTDLGQQDIHVALPLQGEQGKSEYEAVNELFSFYKPSTKDRKSTRLNSSHT